MEVSQASSKFLGGYMREVDSLMDAEIELSERDDDDDDLSTDQDDHNDRANRKIATNRTIVFFRKREDEENAVTKRLYISQGVVINPQVEDEVNDFSVWTIVGLRQSGKGYRSLECPTEASDFQDDTKVKDTVYVQEETTDTLEETPEVVSTETNG